MIEIVGQYNTAICYTGELEEAAAGQIKAVCDQSAFADCKIRITKMLKERIPHEFYQRPGKHNWPYWYNAIKYQFMFFRDRFGTR